jgi:hypothetical protein
MPEEQPCFRDVAAVMGLGLDAWWDAPEYNTCNTFHLRGPFIFGEGVAVTADDPTPEAVGLAAQGGLRSGSCNEDGRLSANRP